MELPKVVQDLRWFQVRWFYYKEKETKEKLIALRGYDSAVAEFAYRQNRKLFIDETLSTIKNVHAGVVLNGLFKINDNVSEAQSIYWKDESYNLWRGTWFDIDYRPLPVDEAEKVEEHHLMCFRNQKIPTQPVYDRNHPMPVLTKLELGSEIKAIWNSVIDVKLERKKTGLFSGILPKKPDERIKRGYKQIHDFDDGVPDLNPHLILVVHGIGQKGFENLIAQNTAKIREKIEGILALDGRSSTSPPVILPVEWRSQLDFNDDVVTTITLPKMSSVRALINAAVSDVMYYQSPLKRREIINTVVFRLNSVYQKFLENNGDKALDVSVVAHSLGSVILYDILMKSDEDSFDNLDFDVKYLFCMGSPLPAFITMRNTREKILPPKEKLSRLFNIFHPYDPVAYRLEALFHPCYRFILPLSVESIGNHQISHFDKEDLLECYEKYTLEKILKREKRDEATLNGDAELDSDSGDDDFGKVNGTPKKLKVEKAQQKVKISKKIDDQSMKIMKELKDLEDMTKIPYRLDYVLSTYWADKAYFALLRSHFRYWDHPDVAKIILNVLYPP